MEKGVLNQAFGLTALKHRICTHSVCRHNMTFCYGYHVSLLLNLNDTIRTYTQRDRETTRKLASSNQTWIKNRLLLNLKTKAKNTAQPSKQKSFAWRNSKPAYKWLIETSQLCTHTHTMRMLYVYLSFEMLLVVSGKTRFSPKNPCDIVHRICEIIIISLYLLFIFLFLIHTHNTEYRIRAKYSHNNSPFKSNMTESN